LDGDVGGQLGVIDRNWTKLVDVLDEIRRRRGSKDAFSLRTSTCVNARSEKAAYMLWPSSLAV